MEVKVLQNCNTDVSVDQVRWERAVPNKECQNEGKRKVCIVDSSWFR